MRLTPLPSCSCRGLSSSWLRRETSALLVHPPTVLLVCRQLSSSWYCRNIAARAATKDTARTAAFYAARTATSRVASAARRPLSAVQLILPTGRWRNPCDPRSCARCQYAAIHPHLLTLFHVSLSVELLVPPALLQVPPPDVLLAPKILPALFPATDCDARTNVICAALTANMCCWRGRVVDRRTQP